MGNGWGSWGGLGVLADGYVFSLVKGCVVCVDQPGGASFGAITFLELGMTFEKNDVIGFILFPAWLVFD